MQRALAQKNLIMKMNFSIQRQKRRAQLKTPAAFGFSSAAAPPSLKKKIDPVAANKQRLKDERAQMNRNILRMHEKQKKKQKALKTNLLRILRSRLTSQLLPIDIKSSFAQTSDQSFLIKHVSC